MKITKGRGLSAEIVLPGAFVADLRGRQSVRATFKLSEKAIGALNIVSIHLGVKQKSLFDHLMEDTEALHLVADTIRNEKFIRKNRIQKTYVLSRRTLELLEESSKNFNTPRDALVEYSIRRLLPVIVKEKERHRKRKKLLIEIERHYKKGVQLLHTARTSLGDEDPVYDKLEAAMRSYGTMYEDIGSFVEKGEVIEDFLQEIG